MICALCQEEWEEPLNLLTLFSFKSQKSRSFCPRCQPLFHYLKPPYCSNCGREWEGKCPDCQKWEEKGLILKNKAIFSYNEAFQQWLLNLKGKGDVRFASAFEKELHQFLILEEGETLVPVPSSLSRVKSRGFHQSEWILKTSGLTYEVLFLPFESNEKQAMKTKKERLSLKLNLNLKRQIQPGEKFVLFDDVYTTGSTLRQIAKPIQEQGGKVRSFTLAR